MAQGLMIDDDYGRLARNYYLRFPTEPYSAGVTFCVDDPTLIRNTSLDTMLQAILDNWPWAGSDLLLVTHGNQRGLTMRLFPKHRTDARTDNLTVLMSDAFSTADTAKRLFITEAQVNSLVDKMNRVQALNLKSVEFRGCNIGKNPDNLTTLRDLLGADSLGGTDELSDFGSVTPKFVSDAQFDFWQKKFSSTAIIVGGLSGGRVGFRITPIVLKDGRHGALSDLIAESKDAVAQWLRLYMCASAPAQFEGWMHHNIPLHYLKVVPPILPLDGSLWGLAGPNTLSMASPSQSYLTHIKRTS